MATSKITRMDAQGRVIIPPHIRKEVGLNAGQQVTVSLEGGTIYIRKAEDRCVICGDTPLTRIAGVPICRSCAEEIASALDGGDA